jgi:hypothetical protein
MINSYYVEHQILLIKPWHNGLKLHLLWGVFNALVNNYQTDWGKRIR